MNPEIKQKWVAALRSGDYEQGAGDLRSTSSFSGIVRHCCLGVLCDLHSKESNIQWVDDEYFGRNDLLPYEVRNWAGLDSASGALVEIGDTRALLPKHNDMFSRTFAEIADAIEAQL